MYALTLAITYIQYMVFYTKAIKNQFLGSQAYPDLTLPIAQFYL